MPKFPFFPANPLSEVGREGGRKGGMDGKGEKWGRRKKKGRERERNQKKKRKIPLEQNLSSSVSNPPPLFSFVPSPTPTLSPFPENKFAKKVSFLPFFLFFDFADIGGTLLSVAASPIPIFSISSPHSSFPPGFGTHVFVMYICT